MIDEKSSELKKDLNSSYPALLNRLEKISKLHQGKIPVFVKKIYMAVLNFCLSFAEKCPKRENNVYEPRIKGEIS